MAKRQMVPNEKGHVDASLFSKSVLLFKLGKEVQSLRNSLSWIEKYCRI